MMKQEISKYIQPFRNIPFDLGSKIDDTDKEQIEELIKKNKFTMLEIPLMMSKFSEDVIYRISVRENIRLYIYSYGIGVFTIKDKVFPIDNDKYAYLYCCERKKSHHSILSRKHEDLEVIYSLIKDLRTIVQDNKKDYNIRKSASEKWENNGLSYVMTVSIIQNTQLKSLDYKDFDEKEKKNLLVMLEPGIIHQDDTMLVEFGDDLENKYVDLYNFTLPNKEPVNWIKSRDVAIYISWAAVVVYFNKIDEEAIQYLEYMEVDLQAMWLYIYCLYFEISHKNREKMKISSLQNQLFSFRKKYNEFKNPSDSSMAEYFSNIRNELIETSGIERKKQEYINYLEYCINETQSLNEEKTKKYSVLNEILLFIIAYVQIAPMLYNFLMGEYSGLGIWQVIVVVIIAFVGVFLIIRKE